VKKVEVEAWDLNIRYQMQTHFGSIFSQD